jgi:hypothetical protein
MNHLLYNISVVMLLSGIVILTSYLTKAYNIQKCPKEKKNKDIDYPSIDDQYDARPSKIFDAMFNKPSIWQGYESVQTSKNKNV